MVYCSDCLVVNHYCLVSVLERPLCIHNQSQIVMHKHHFIYLLSLLFSLNIVAQQPQQTIRGTVLDISSNAPLPNVSVVLLNTNFATTTDSLGDFILKNVSVGRYTIQVSMIGYESFVLKEVQVSSGKELFLNI